MASRICSAEALSAARSPLLSGISRISCKPFRPTMDGRLSAKPFIPYCPSSTADTGSTARSSFTMASAMRPTAMAMP